MGLVRAKNLRGGIDMQMNKETEQYLPYAADFILAPSEDLKKLSTKALNHRIKYLRELVIISHKNGYKPPKNIVAELNELIAIKKGEINGNKNNNHKEF